MDSLEKMGLKAAETIAPNAPIIEIAEAAIATALAPTPANTLSDIELIITLVKQLKDLL
jgi:hypothetical protein